VSVFEIFSKRQRRVRGDFPTVLTFDIIDDHLKVQIVHIIRDAFGVSTYNQTVEKAHQAIIDALCREYGVFALVPYADRVSPIDHLTRFFLEEKDIDRQLDVVEFAFRYFDKIIRESYEYKSSTIRKLEPDDAISELNTRFKEHGLGYAYEAGFIIKMDSTYMHQELTVPALQILHEDRYSGAMSEFLKAHEHYRHGRNQEAINEALKAFESVLKTICERKKWPFKATDTAKNLIEICFDNGLVPQFLKSEMGSLRGLLESGLPTIRNRTSAHGQGSEPKPVDESLTKYCLNIAASNIRFFGEVAR
jgi:hypothetical protein